MTMKDSVLSRWKAQKKDSENVITIPKAPEGLPIPLSNGQQRLWFLQQMYPSSSFYNYAESYHLRGPWETDKLKASIQSIYLSHEILRSSCVSNEAGVFLRSDATTPLNITEYDLGHLSAEVALEQAKELITEQTGQAFALDKPPLMRVSLLKLAAQHHILTIALHHIIVDEWSMQIFINQLASCYKAFEKGEQSPAVQSALQFKDYAVWDNTRLIRPTLLNYWKEKLSGEIPVLDLQKDYKRPTQPSYKGKAVSRYYSRELSDGLMAMSAKNKVTPFVLMLSIFHVILFRHTGQTDLLIGSPIANRDQKVLENLLGFFVETLVLRTQIEENFSFRELLDLVRSNTLEAFSNKGVPFDMLVKELNLGRSLTMNPFFQVMFVYNASAEQPDFGNNLGFEKNNLVAFGTSKFDLTLFVSEQNGVFSTTIEYATDLFKESTMKRLLSHIEVLSKSILVHDAMSISDIPMLTDSELQFFNQKSSRLRIPSDQKSGVHQRIAKMALEYPDRKAVTYGQDSITYFALEARANLVARSIVNRTQGKNEMIGLMVPRSIDMIVGLLAILKAGAAYVPLDPEYPKGRINYILRDANIRLILTDERLANEFNDSVETVLLISDVATAEISDPIELPTVKGDDLAYVIYTSGSTGNPKGVAITHDNIISSTRARLEFYPENPGVFLLLSSVSFDSSKAGIFWTLCVGGCLVVAEKRIEQDMSLMEAVIARNRVTHLLLLPTLYQLILEYADKKKLDTLTTVIVAGESCPEKLPQLHFNSLPTTLIFNEYGPTEATVWCTVHQLKKNDEFKTVPIGKAIPGAQIYLFDKNRAFVPYGAKGEMYVSGAGLSAGYLNQKVLTQTRFIEWNWHDGTKKERLYKTGDLGRYRHDGAIEFLGRADQQVKLRGYRIELDEIESVLRAHRAVESAVVAIGSKQPQQMIAFVVPMSNYSENEVLSHLRSQLPKHMVPSKIVTLKALPELPNGKVDRPALQNIYIGAEKNDSVIGKEVKSETEEKLMAIWVEVLGISDLSIYDNFFEVGGDSIMSIQIIAKSRKRGLPITPDQLFEYQTISQLSGFIDANERAEDKWNYMIPLRKEGSKNPLFCIHAGGGHVFFYTKLADYLDPEVPIYALQPSGLYGQKAMHENIYDMTKTYLDAIREVRPHGPYNILVYCFSAAVGNEMAVMLRKMEEQIHLIVMDTMTAPAVLNTPRRLKIRAIGFLMRLLRSPLRSVKEMLLSKYAMVRLKWKSNFESDAESKELEKLRVNLMRLSRTYDWKSLPGKVSLILTRKDHKSLNEETIRSWQEIAENEIDIHYTAGNHKVLFDEPFVEQTAKAIENCLSE